MIWANEKACKKAWAGLQITEQMSCRKRFSRINCMNCDYYYVEEDDDGYRIARCLKENIRNWTLYRIEKGYGRK